jgi:phospholipid transport system substrate-binding protein
MSAIAWQPHAGDGAAVTRCGFGLCHHAHFAITVAPAEKPWVKTMTDAMSAMPILRRAFLMMSASFAASVSIAPRCALAADTGAASVAVIQHFYDVLLAVMKDAKQLSFDQRYQRLAPTVTQTYNLPLMSRLAVGPGWAQLPPAQQQSLTDAFASYTIAEYANQFDGYSGERFEVNPAPATSANGPIVQSSLVKSNGEKVALNYLMRQGSDGAWQVIDVYLSGTISQLATRRAEFTSVLQQGGGEALLKLLEQRIAALHTG